MSDRIFTREELDDLELPYSSETQNFVESRRWYDIFEIIFEFEDKFYSVLANFPATEMQEDIDPWDDRATVIGHEVEYKEVKTWKWVPVE